MTLIEVTQINNMPAMISPAHVSEVIEHGGHIEIRMASGSSYNVSRSSFGGMLNALEDAKYLKVDRAAADEITETE